MIEKIKFVEIITGITTGIFTGIIANTLNYPLSRLINEANLRKFMGQLNTWIEDFAKNHHTCNIILNDEFANYIESRNVIKQVIDYVLASSFKNTGKSMFIEEEKQNCIKFMNPTSQRSNAIDEEKVINEFLDTLFEKVQSFAKDNESDSYIIFLLHEFGSDHKIMMEDLENARFWGLENNQSLQLILSLLNKNTNEENLIPPEKEKRAKRESSCSADGEESIDNETSEHYEKKILISNKTEYDQNKYVSVCDLLCSNLNKKNHTHYLISADGGMGKSYEMKKAFMTIHNKLRKENQSTLYHVQSYFCDLKNFHSSNVAPWKYTCPKEKSEIFYVFLDGLDELSEKNQVTIKKMIATELNTRKHTYFVISGRTTSFEYTGVEDIFTDKNKINCHITIPTDYVNEKNKLIIIPFFRNEVDKLKNDNKTIAGDISVVKLMKAVYENEFEKTLNKHEAINKFTEKEKYKKLTTTLGDFAYTIFCKECNTWTENDINKFLKFNIENIDDLELFLKESAWISTDKSDENEIKYSFSHRIHQEYLIAFNLVQPVEDEIPEVFLAGEKNEIVKNKYSNIFALWLQLLDSEQNIIPAIKTKAIKLLKTTENIQILFMCDDINLDETIKYSIFEYVIDHLDELPFLRDYIEKIANLVKLSNEENKLKAYNILIEKIKTKILNGTNDYVYLYIQILANITNKDDSTISISIIPKIEKLIKLIIDVIEKSSTKKKKYNEMEGNLFSLNDIVKICKPEFRAYREILKYKDIDESYKRDFKVYQIARDFYIAYFSNEDKDIDVIENYHYDLLSIIVDVAINYPRDYGNFDIENTISDEYIAPEPISLDTPVFYFEAFLDTFIERDDPFKNTKTIPATIPDSFRVFILEAIELLIDQYDYPSC